MKVQFRNLRLQEFAAVPQKQQAQWIWSDKASDKQTLSLQKSFTVSKAGKGQLTFTCDNAATLWLNGRKVASSKDWQKPQSLNVRLKKGEWPDGHVKGLRARGGYTVDLTWRQGKLSEARITAQVDGTCRLRYQGSLSWQGKKSTNGLLSIPVKAGQTYILKP